MKMSNIVKVYLVKTSEFNLEKDRIMDRLTKARLEKVYSLRNPQERLTSLIAGYMLSKVLGIQSDNEIYENRYGKPYMADNSLYFSLSHSDEYVALATAEFEIGIDLESIDARDVLFDAVRYVATKSEKEWLDSHGNEGDAFVLWTRKEAMLKARGTGFHANPNEIDVLKPKGFFMEHILDSHYALACCGTERFSMKIIKGFENA